MHFRGAAYLGRVASKVRLSERNTKEKTIFLLFSEVHFRLKNNIIFPLPTTFFCSIYIFLTFKTLRVQLSNFNEFTQQIKLICSVNQFVFLGKSICFPRQINLFC